MFFQINQILLKIENNRHNKYNKNIYLSILDPFRKSPGTKQPERESAGASFCDCDPGSVEVQRSKTAESLPIEDCIEQNTPITLPHITAVTETMEVH